MGVDISHNTGYWIYDRKNKRIIYAENYKIDSSKTMEEKIIERQYSTTKIIKKFLPLSIVFEDTFVNPIRARSIKPLMFFHGVDFFLYYNLGTNIYLVNNQSAKKAVKAKNKKEVFENIKKKYNLTDFTFNKHNDITDAGALVEAFLQGAYTKYKWH